MERSEAQISTDAYKAQVKYGYQPASVASPMVTYSNIPVATYPTTGSYLSQTGQSYTLYQPSGTPVYQSTAAPVYQSTAAPVYQSSAPVYQTTAAPVYQSAAPVYQSTAAPVYQAAYPTVADAHSSNYTLNPAAYKTAGQVYGSEGPATFGAGYPTFPAGSSGAPDHMPTQEELAAYYYKYIMPTLPPIFAEPSFHGNQARSQEMPQQVADVFSKAQTDALSKAPSVVSVKPLMTKPLAKITPKKQKKCPCAC